MTRTETKQTREQSAKVHRIRCNKCGKAVSSPVPEETVIRAWIVCPECIEVEKE